MSLNPVSEESSTTGVLTKVTAGQADAGVVLMSDEAQKIRSQAGFAKP